MTVKWTPTSHSQIFCSAKIMVNTRNKRRARNKPFSMICPLRYVSISTAAGLKDRDGPDNPQHRSIWACAPSETKHLKNNSSFGLLCSPLKSWLWLGKLRWTVTSRPLQVNIADASNRTKLAANSPQRSAKDASLQPKPRAPRLSQGPHD